MRADPPSISAVLLTYDCADFAAQAVRSVLSQECRPMEVLISDDASSDDTYRIIQEEVGAYTGPHTVTVRRRDRNSGSKSAHLNDAFPQTSGELVVLFDGDDVSEPHRVRRLAEAFGSGPGVFAAYSGYSLMDSQGRPGGPGLVPHPDPEEDPAPWFARVDAFASGATLAVRREVIDAFPPLDPKINEDVVLPFRAALLGDVVYVDEELVRVRRWTGSLTAQQERFRSWGVYRDWMLEGIEQAGRQLECRLADLQVARDLMPQREAEFDELREVARASLSYAQDTAGLVSPSFRVRARAFLRMWRAGTYREHLGQSAALAFLPRTYLHLKRRALGKEQPDAGSGESTGTDPSGVVP